MAKKRRKKRRRETPRPPRAKVELELSALELAAGHDGFMRGKPEPIVLLGAYWVGAETKTLGRVAAHFAKIGEVPCTAKPTHPAVLSARVPRTGRFVVVAIALEEDAGTDVARVYSLMESLSGLHFWASGAEIPAPAPLDQLPLTAAPVVLPIHVLEGARDLGDRCTQDKYIGAVAVGVPADGHPHELRLRFTSADRRNDWTALISVYCYAPVGSRVAAAHGQEAEADEQQ